MFRARALSLLCAVVFAAVSGNTTAQPAPSATASEPAPATAKPPKKLRKAIAPIAPQRIRFVHMGGNDCPPCVVWRAQEYPKLTAAPAFTGVGYSYVVKAVKSPVPPEFFLPDELKPWKARLDLASGGRSGSPHQAILVDDEVYDYWFGPLDAVDIAARIGALVDGTAYPGKRCVRRTGGPDRSCAQWM